MTSPLEAVAARLEDQAAAPNTRRAYGRYWRRFCRWCAEEGRRPEPASAPDVRLWLASLAAEGLGASSLRLGAAAIRRHHLDGGHPDPTAARQVRSLISGAARAKTAPPRQARPLTTEGMALIRERAFAPRVHETDEQAFARGLRDVALCSVMREALLRASEAATIRWEHIQREPDGSGRLLLLRSKSDQEAAGAMLYLGRQAMNDLDAVRDVAAPRPSDKVFAGDRSAISRRIRAIALRAGLGDGYSGHSPRVGMAVALGASGATLVEMQQAGRWKSPRMPAHYARGSAAGRGAVARLYQQVVEDDGDDS